jgi:hypothetical protein
MPLFRITIRFGSDRPRYEVLDIEADTLRDAVSKAGREAFSDEVAASADLIEIRRQIDPGSREYTAE